MTERESETAVDQPNVVLVTYDSLRADHCGFMGYDRDTTPAMDRLAADGVVFENAIASGVPTIASMTSVMTGEHSLASPEIGFNEEQREQVTGRQTLAEVLSEAGYSTGALSPNPPASSYFGFDDGFDWFEDFLAEEDSGLLERAWDRVFQRSIEGGSIATYVRLLRNVIGREEVLRPWEDYYDELLEWRESVEEPYFLWILLLEPHHPWFPPTEYQQWSSRGDKYRSFRHYWEMLNSDWRPDFDEDVHRRLVDLYDDSIRYGDAFLEQLQADLADDDPVFLVHADHGEEFGERGRYGHQPHLTEELIHVPLVVGGNVEAIGADAEDAGGDVEAAGADVEAAGGDVEAAGGDVEGAGEGVEGIVQRGQRVETPVGLRELAPTIAELAGADHPFSGRDLLAGEPTDVESTDRPWVTSKVFAEGDRRAAVRTATRKYLRAGDRTELVDVASGERQAIDGAGDEDDVDGGAPFAGALDAHVAAEEERRRIRSSAERLHAEGDV